MWLVRYGERKEFKKNASLREMEAHFLIEDILNTKKEAEKP